MATYTAFTSRFMVIILLFVSFFGVFFCAQMVKMTHTTMGASHQMDAGSCDHAADPSACSMDVGEHVSAWTSRFVATLVGNLAIALVASVAFFAVINLAREMLDGFAPAVFLYRYLREHRQLQVYNNLIELFASGILQRRVYA